MTCGRQGKHCSNEVRGDHQPVSAPRTQGTVPRNRGVFVTVAPTRREPREDAMDEHLPDHDLKQGVAERQEACRRVQTHERHASDAGSRGKVRKTARQPQCGRRAQ